MSKQGELASELDKFKEKLSDLYLSPASLSKLVDMVDSFMKEKAADDSNLQSEAAMIKELLRAKMKENNENVNEEEPSKNKAQKDGKSVNGKENSTDDKGNAQEKPHSKETKQDEKNAIKIDENKLPRLQLAGKEGVSFDLNEIADEIKALPRGGKLALGRAPEKVGVEGKSVTVGENNRYVSRHHCDIMRDENGELKLVDCSANGTKILDAQEKDPLRRLLEKSRGIRKPKFAKVSLDGAKKVISEVEFNGKIKAVRDRMKSRE